VLQPKTSAAGLSSVMLLRRCCCCLTLELKVTMQRIAAGGEWTASAASQLLVSLYATLLLEAEVQVLLLPWHY
jgi:hypothetical protein